MAMGGTLRIDLPVGCKGWHQKTALDRGVPPQKLAAAHFNYDEWVQIMIDNYATIDVDAWAQREIEGRA